MKIYIAGPYSDPVPVTRQQNVDRAMDAGIAMIRLGHTPYIPHLSHYLAQRQENLGQKEIPYLEWIALDLEWLLCCDALLLLAPSHGSGIEVLVAKAKGLPIYDRVQSVPTPSSWTYRYPYRYDP